MLLIAGSDHGHETVTGIVDIEDELVTAGLKAAMQSDDVVIAANGTSALVYVHPDHAARLDALDDFLRSRPWAGAVIGADDLGTVGQAPLHGLAFAISLKGDDAPMNSACPAPASR